MYKRQVKGKVITFGHSRGNDYSAGDIQYDNYAHPSFDLYIGGEKKERLTLGVAGEHNVYNALAAIAVSQMCIRDSLILLE